MRTIVAIVLAALLSACAGMDKVVVPPVVFRDVPVPVQIRCKDVRPPAPDLPDDDEDLAAIPETDIFRLAQVYRAARTLYRQRLSEDDVQIKGCAGDQ